MSAELYSYYELYWRLCQTVGQNLIPYQNEVYEQF
jgi:hypothetical protein